jgi:hypothetical protein
VAANLTDAAAREQILASTAASIASDIDDLCPPIPWPGPPWWHWQVVVDFGIVANALQEGELRSEVTRVAAELLQRGIGSAKTQTR